MLTRLWNVFRQSRLDGELRDELESHMAMLEESERATGATPEEAKAAARVRFGSTLAHRERSLDALIATWLDTVFRDVKYAVRQMKNAPLLTAVLVLTLGLGIGGTVAVFSVVDSVLLRPLPFSGGERIVLVWETLRELNRGSAAAGVYADWTERNRVFETTAAASGAVFTLADAGDPERLTGTRVTPGYFELLATPPALGRYFSQEDIATDQRLVVLSYGLWQRRFAGDPAIVGRSIRLGGESYRVVAVAPGGFTLGDGRRPVVGGLSSQLWTPLTVTAEDRANYGSHGWRVLGKLKPGVTPAAAQADLERVMREIVQEHPVPMTGRGVAVTLLRDSLVDNFRTQTWLLLAAVGTVLLIGCVNVSSILLARATTRSREMAIRAAVGGGRGRLIRQLLTESIVMVAAGGLAALIVAYVGIEFLVRMGPDVPRLQDAALDLRVLAFASLLTIVAGLLAGTGPAIRAARVDPQHALRDRTGSNGRAHDITRSALVVVEFALAVVLTISAGLFVRSLVRVQQIPLGFDVERTLMARTSLPAATYATDDGVARAYGSVIERLRAMPGVVDVGASTDVPMQGSGIDVAATIEGPEVAVNALPIVQFHLATDRYIETMRIPLVRGRTFEANDMRAGAPRIAVVNQRLAERLWPGQDAVGKRIRMWTNDPTGWREVVGVVGDTRSSGQAVPIAMEAFIPYAQAPERAWAAYQRSMALVVRTSDAPDAATSAVRSALSSVDPGLPMYATQTLERVVDGSVEARRFNMSLLSMLAGIGVLLAGVGIYGVVAFFVVQRRAEIGLRIALGASAGSVLWMVLRHGGRLALVGVGIGTLLAVLASRVLATLLFEISPTDPLTYGVGGVALLALALVACAVPALMAARVSPLRTLSGQ